jgi:cobalt-zinc-cadmium efflux system protein
MHNHGHAHAHETSAAADRRWLLGALAVVVVFMCAEVVAGVLAHSLALLTDSAHLLSDAVALAVAVLAARLAQRPAAGSYTYGFARVDALSGQGSGITLMLLALWFAVQAIRRLVDPPEVHGGVVLVVALIGVAANLVATALAGRADRSSLNVRGVVAHLVTDIWAFVATVVAGAVVLGTGWTRADPVASLVVATVMAWTGWRLVHAAGRVFLEAAPAHLDPAALGAELVDIDGVAELHDLHVWEIGPRTVALSAHVLVTPAHDCHEVAERVRADLRAHGIGHVTLQTDHADAAGRSAGHAADTCADSHGVRHVAPTHRTEDRAEIRE